MKVQLTAVAFLAVLSSSALGKGLPEGKYVKIPFSKRKGGENDELSKRSNRHESFVLANEQSFYSVELAIGTPSQNLTVLLDTGSADLWVPGKGNPYCGSVMDCEHYGVFDKSKSSTFKANKSSPFYAAYGDGTYAEGAFGQDKLKYNELDLSGLSFAVANESNSTFGVFGIGLSTLEVTYSGKVAVMDKRSYQYDNFPLFLKHSGAIDATAYSLFLNDESQASGNILFGAVDHSKYEGQLYTIPLINLYKSQGYQHPVAFDVTLQDLGLQTDKHNITLTTTKLPVLLDSGTTLTYLPSQAVALLAKSVNASYSKTLGYYEYTCPSSNNKTSVAFDFGGFRINAPLSDFTMQTSVGTCALAIIPQTGNTTAILGDSFLRNAYVVYDLDNYEVSLAQAKYGTGKENIEAIKSTVPSAIKAPSYNNTWSTYASATSYGNIFTTTVTTTRSSSTKKTKSNTTAKATYKGKRALQKVAANSATSTHSTFRLLLILSLLILSDFFS